MEDNLNQNERREFPRTEFLTPLAYKVCKQETLSKLFEGYTVNISQSGLLCSLKNKVNLEDILWLSFNKSVLIFCEEMEKRSFFYQNGVIGKVVRIQDNANGTFNVGVNFLTREEKNLPETLPRFQIIEDHEEI